MAIAFQNYDITDPKVLFGRSAELSILYNFAESLDQVELIGARRFGKTCTLKCLQTMLKNSKDVPAIPIYVDMKSDNVKGTANVYRYLTARVFAELYIEEWIDATEIDLEDVKITPSEEWEKIYKQLNSFSEVEQIIMIFKKVVNYYSSMLEQCFLFLFDEYEYLATKAFDKQDAFMTIRKISMEILPCGISPISFWLAGASPWSKFIVNNNNSIGGSGEFNGVTNTRYLLPLEKESFEKMWKFECEKITDESLKKELILLSEQAYKASGGVPFYAKAIGKEIRATKKFPDYTVLQNQFVEMEKLFSDQERKLLREISCSPKKYDLQSASLKKLLNYGLISMDKNGKYIIPIQFYTDYCRANIFESRAVTKSTTFQEKQDKVITLMHDINENWKYIKREYLFNLSNPMSKQQNILHTQCTDELKFAPFIDAIYVIYWDSNTINNGPNQPKEHKLPRQFSNSTFRKSMDTLRHYFGMAHFTEDFHPLVSLPNALYEIYGSQTRPQTPSEWLHLQECMLSRFVNELEKLNDYVKGMIPKRK